MATSYPLATLAPTISSAGITVPSLEDILQSLIASAKTIFGSDVYLETDAQDYQLLAIFAQAQYDSNMATVAAYNSFSPKTAIGSALSNNVAINGIERQAGTNSTAVLQLGGQAGTFIEAGIVRDANGLLWDIPADTVIPNSGIIEVTATCETVGAITAEPGTINQIFTQVIGWQTATNPGAATQGTSQETDGELRIRQAGSTAIPSQSALSAISGAVANVAGVTRSIVYENDTNAADANGIPAHNISAVVAGGDAATIAQVIEITKGPGPGTYGTTSETVSDPNGLPITINFFTLANVPIYVGVTIHPLPGYVNTTATAIQEAIADFINGLAIGEDVYQSWLLAEAGLVGTDLQQTFVITSLTLGTAANPNGTNTVVINFNQAATADPNNVVVTLG